MENRLVLLIIPAEKSLEDVSIEFPAPAKELSNGDSLTDTPPRSDQLWISIFTPNEGDKVFFVEMTS